MNKLLEIDELNIDLHPHLILEEDFCYYIMEYTKGKGHAHSASNSTILNFKKSVDQKGSASYKYKGKAIREIADIYSLLFPPETLQGWTLIPIPPSKCKSDKSYDDRMTQLLNTFCGQKNYDVRELLLMKESMTSSHSSGNRPSITDIYSNLIVDESISRPVPNKIILFDDVITAGTHFKACKKKLSEVFPNVEKIFGVFIARRVFDEPQTEFTITDL